MLIVLLLCCNVLRLSPSAMCALAPPDIKVEIASATPRKTIKTIMLNTGQTLQLHANVSGTDDKQVIWSIREPKGGLITPEGLYTAPGQADTYHVRAVSRANPEAAAELTISVLDVRNPDMDAGRFYLYRNLISEDDDLPFIPYGWMPEAAPRILGGDPADPQDKDGFNPFCKDPKVLCGFPIGEKQNFQSCIAVTVKHWVAPDWCGVSFLSGPPGLYKKVGRNRVVADPMDPAWWGETNRGWYYNFADLNQRHLVFYARGETGGETLQIQIGNLAGKPFGDSLKRAQSSGMITLTASWQPYTISLKGFPAQELSRICSPFMLMIEKKRQTKQGQKSMRFYLADIYLE